MNERVAVGHQASLAVLSAIVLSGSPLRSQEERPLENWSGWRGPTGLGYTNERDLPLTWSAKTGENILWKTLLHGGRKANPEFSSPGWSCPIVWRDRIFLTTSVWPADFSEKERRGTVAQEHVLCFDLNDGHPLWDTVVPPGGCLVDNFYHGYSVPTPVTDGTSVFALLGSGVLVAVDFGGKILWREELPHLKEVYGGVCSSPILYGDTVIVPGLSEGGLRALEKGTGKPKWEQKTRDRNTMSTPALIRIGERTELIHHAGGIQALDPGTGELLWFCRGVTSAQSSPVYGSGVLYTDAGRGGQFCNAVDPTGKGDVSKTGVKWQVKGSTAAGSSGIAVGPYVYRSCDPGLVRCRDLATGETVYEERTPRISPSASPIASADGRIYFASPARSYVLKAGPQFEILATNDLDDGPDYTTPAVSQARIVIKGKSYLWCIGTKERK